MKQYDKKLENYLQHGVDYGANTISKTKIEDLQQLIADSYFQGWNDALSECQTNTETSTKNISEKHNY